MSSFAVQRIIIQRKEKISILKKILEKTTTHDIQKSLYLQIKEQEKDLEYFENMGVLTQ